MQNATQQKQMALPSDIATSRAGLTPSLGQHKGEHRGRSA